MPEQLNQAEGSAPETLVDAIALHAQAMSQPPPTGPPARYTKLKENALDVSASLIKSGAMLLLAYLLIQSVELDLKQAEFTANVADKPYSFVTDFDPAFAQQVFHISKG